MHFLSSMRADRCIADADVLVDLAHVLMLDKQKIIDPDTAQQLPPALLGSLTMGIPEEVFDDRFEDVHRRDRIAPDRVSSAWMSGDACTWDGHGTTR